MREKINTLRCVVTGPDVVLVVCGFGYIILSLLQAPSQGVAAGYSWRTYLIAFVLLVLVVHIRKIWIKYKNYRPIEFV
jgi:hypothetical protein